MKHHTKREELAGQRAEKQRLAPFMRALKAIHSAATPEVMNVEDLTKQRKIRNCWAVWWLQWEA